ncbi:SDR family oxidoreductase [Pseudonocardia kujensis]|uniref:SDR family NAD(P)-dependent oxidoreductase n=1 Tax=Pseudonocardia kujensis TaxID=1128675 RepID=UPI001E4D4559|nr:SDR family NAD(P)-dependent oxidoreductase [Pseudonocardia kujensis]MCE0767804.1 SDR family oxidoreductase [Pseudonocardia kujensis]
MDALARFVLDGRAALVTGGSRGIGLATARLMAAAGAAVAVVGRSRDALDAAVRTVEEDGERALAVVGDVADPAQHGRILAETVDAFGRLDVLVNNAGLNRRSSACELTPELYDEVHAVNAKGPILLSAAAQPYLAAHGVGSVVNVLSIGMWTGGPGLLPYRTAKSALHAATLVLAQEWGSDGIRVNAVVPGMIGDAMGGRADDDARRAAKAATPIGRGGEPDELAHAVLFLASDASSYMTGSVLKVDGGAYTGA